MENKWAPSSVIDVGPGSDASDVEAGLVEIKGNMFSPPVGVFWVYTGPVILGEIIVPVIVGTSVIPGVKAVCVVSASLTVSALRATVSGEAVLIEEASFGMEVGTVTSTLGEETPWTSVGVDAALSAGVASVYLVGSISE